MTTLSHNALFSPRPARAEGFLRRLSPLPKVCFALGFLALVVSFGRYGWRGCVVFALLPFLAAALGGISPAWLGRRALLALPFVLCAGVANLFFDHRPVEVWSGAEVPGGVVSLVVLVAKTAAAVGVALTLSASTRIGEMAGAMAFFRVPCILILQFQLVCRYLGVLLEEARGVTNASRLRDPDHGTVPLRHWGTLVGRLFLRSVERADAVYRAMQCRLFRADTPLPRAARGTFGEWLGVAALLGICVFLRAVL